MSWSRSVWLFCLDITYGQSRGGHVFDHVTFWLDHVSWWDADHDLASCDRFIVNSLLYEWCTFPWLYNYEISYNIGLCYNSTWLYHSKCTWKDIHIYYGLLKQKQNLIQSEFLPETSFGLRVLSSPVSVYLFVCLCVCVSTCVSITCLSACPIIHQPFRTTKFGTEVQSTLVKIRIILEDDWLWPSRSNLTWKLNFTSFWACQQDN